MNIHFGTKSPIRTPRQVVLRLDPQRVLSHSLEAEPWLGDTITHLRRANSLCQGIGSAVGRWHSDDSLAMPLMSLLVHSDAGRAQPQTPVSATGLEVGWKEGQGIPCHSSGHPSQNPKPLCRLVPGSPVPEPNENICNYNDNIMILKGIRFC